VRTSLLVLAALLAARLSPGAAAAQQPGSTAPAAEQDFDPRPFRIRDTQAARWRLDEIRGHVQSQRWSEALDGLQELLDEHAADVLGPELARLNNGQSASEPTHYGAAQRARALLFGLPNEARALYRTRHEADARAALERARERLGRRALWEVARRYPLTRSARRAAWLLGDLEWEQAHTGEALAAWGHGLALSLERGELELASARDWNEALESLRPSELLDAAERDAIARRVATALTALEAAQGNQTGDHPGSAGARRPPGRDADAWYEPCMLPAHPFANQGRPNLLPARAGNTLFVSTSLRVLALDAYTGALRWKSEEPPGWSALTRSRRDEFEKGLDVRDARIAPAADERVVVAALQIPVTFIDNQSLQRDIQITKIIPDRRLFAFDSATGAPLWNHLPPPDWDGDAGGFVERMSVAGPPVIAGSRLLVPCYRMQGRIDYHVACFDLDTGSLLWSTDVISGQRELNMFGRPQREFSAPQLAVRGARVVALTQLGALASLDLYTGEVHWVTLYPQIPLPRNRNMDATLRPVVWSNQPPLITEDAVLAAPVDSYHLVGVDLESGVLSWTLSNDARSRGGDQLDVLAGQQDADFDQLIGARGDTLYLAGRRVMALRSPAGLARAAPLTRSWIFEHEELDRDDPRPFAVLADDRLVLPLETRCLTLDTLSGRPVDTGLEWGVSRGDGNILVHERELFVLSNRRATGYFDWGVLVQRARAAAAAAPADAGLALRLGRLLANRGEYERATPGQASAARASLDEARGVLERALGGGEGALASEIGAELHRVLRSQARLFAALADTREAALALARARTLAPGAEELRDTLLEELALARRRGGPTGVAGLAEPEELYALLDQHCGELSLLCDPLHAAPLPAPNAGPELRPEELPFAFEPVIGAESRPNLVPIELPVPVWTLLARERTALLRRDTPREFVLLHRLLAEHADVGLVESTVGERATRRIGELLRGGQRAGYEPFEAQAEQELSVALAARDRERLESLSRRFPYSGAARRANDARLDWAQEEGRLADVATILQHELAPGWTPRAALPRELALCLRLADTARAAGAEELAAGLVRALAEAQPDGRADTGVHAGRRLAELVADYEAHTPAAVEPAPARFGPGLVAQDEARLMGEFEHLGRVPAAEGGGEDLIVGYCVPSQGGRRAAAIYALEPTHLARRWNYALPHSGGPIDTPVLGPWRDHVLFTRGRLLVAMADALVGVDTHKGEEVWSWPVPGATPRQMHLAHASGVALLTVTTDDGVRSYAFEPWSGAALWQDGPQPHEFQREPLLSATRVVSLPKVGQRGVRVRDLFTGRRLLDWELDIPANPRIVQQAWIEGERLIVPRIPEPSLPAFNQILCHSLVDGQRVWKIAVGDVASDKRYVTDVLQTADKTYLLLKTAPGPNVQMPQLGLYELSTSIGAVAPILNVRFAPEDRIVGTQPEGRTRLSSPLVLVVSNSQNGEARVRAVDLERGELWSQGLGVPHRDWQPAFLPAPAWSESSVALGFSVLLRQRAGTQSHSTHLALFDRQSGVLREPPRALDPRTVDKADQLGLYPWGGVLALRLKNRLEFLK